MDTESRPHNALIEGDYMKFHHYQLDHKYTHVFQRYLYLFLPESNTWMIRPYKKEDRELVYGS